MIKASELNCTDYFDLFIERQEKEIKWACEKDQRSCSYCEIDLYLKDKIIPFEDYRSRIENELRRSGYKIVPTGYIGGVWQHTQRIVW